MALPGRFLGSLPLPQRSEAPAYHGLEAPIGRFAAATVFGQISLIHPALGLIVTVRAAFAMTALLGAAIVAVAQMHRHRERQPGMHVLACLAEPRGAAFG